MRPKSPPPKKNRIKFLRYAARLTQEGLGQRVGLTGAAVSRHENHQRHIDEDTARRYEQVLGNFWC